MLWPSFTHLPLLAAAGAIAIWVSVIAFSRPTVPGGRIFGWLNLAIALWCLSSAFHALDQTLEARVLWAQVQYIGIVAVPPLWLLFAADYARSTWAADRRWRRAVWIVPALELIAVFTNESHRLYWTSIVEIGQRVSYGHGPLFWASVAYNYSLVAAGTITLLRAFRIFSSVYRTQTAALVIATLWPWIGNLLYVSGVFTPGYDPTPLLFVVSLLLFVWALYAHQLFELVPVARAAVFDRISDAVFVLDRAYRVIDANAAAVAIAGDSRRAVSLHEVIGHHPTELLPWWSKLSSPPSPSDAEPSVVETGDRILEVQTGTFVDARGYGGSLLWVRDVTARRKAEFERAALERKLHEQRHLEGMTVMAAGLAHDFNNLLTAILGNADYIAAIEPEGSEARASAEEIAAAAQYAADLISYIVAFSGQGRSIPGTIALDDAVGDMMRAVSRTMGERARVTHESEPNLPEFTGDVVQIRQAVLALLTNGVDAVADRRGHVEVKTGRERLDAASLASMTYSAAEPGEFVYVEVKDDGPGMPREVLQRVFEPFFSTRDMGRGLGLPAVHGIVRSHRGAIRIWTEPSDGTRVRVWWPVE